MRDAVAFQQRAQIFAALHRDGAHQYRLARGVHLRNLLHHAPKLGGLGGVDGVVRVIADHRLIGRNLHNVQIVDVHKLGFFRLCRTCHSRQLLIHPEIILQRYSRQSF